MRIKLRHIPIILGLIVLLLSIPLTVYLARQKQELRSKAQKAEVQTELEIEAVNSSYGVHGSPDISRDSAEMISIAEKLSEAGVKWVRPASSWPWHNVEPQKGQWSWDRMDTVYQVNYNYGLQTLLTLMWTPQWASSAPGCPLSCPTDYWKYPAKDIEDWKTFVRQMVRRYGANGKNIVKFWEIWNEPDSSYLLVPPGVDKVGIYFQLLKSAYEIIKEEDPLAKVVLGGLTNIGLRDRAGKEGCGADDPNRCFFADDLLKMGAANYFDVFNIHTYEVDPTIAVSDSKRLLTKYGLNKPIWMTETNPKESLPPNKLFDEQATADAIAPWYRTIINAGVEKVFYFYIRNWCRPENCDPDTDPTRRFGLIKPDFSVQPLIYNAYKNMAVTYTPPGQPSLISPANNSQITDPRPVFKWNAVSPGSEGLAGYMIQIDNDPNFLSPDFERFIQAPNLEFTPLQIAKGSYYWRIKAQDNQGNFGRWSNPWQVTVNPHYLALDSPFGMYALLYTGASGSDSIPPATTIAAVQKMAEAGVKFVRTNMSLVSISPSRGEFNWTAADRRMQILANFGIEPVTNLSGIPIWASAAPSCCQTVPIPRNCPLYPPGDPNKADCYHYMPKQWEDYENLLEQIVRRYGYGPGGKKQIKYWEIWNEPDNYQFFYGSANDFFRLQQTAYRKIKAVDPQAVVLTGSFTPQGILNLSHIYVKPNFVEDFFKLGGGNYFDIFNFHPYGPYGEGATAKDYVNRAKDYLARYNVSQKPIWATETNSGPAWDPSGQAAAMAAWYSELINTGLGKAFWMYVLDYPQDRPDKKWCGLFSDNTSLTTTACYNSYQQMAPYYTLPDQPTLVSPANNSQITDPRPVFKWNAASPGSEELAGYMIQVDNTDGNFLTPEIFSSATTLEFTPPTNLAQGTYYWRVKAKDSKDNFGTWSETWSFTITTPGSSSLALRIKFQGVSVQRGDKQVGVILRSGGGQVFNAVTVTSDNQGFYSGTVTNITPGTYEVLIKGPSHLQKNFGSVAFVAGQTTTKDWSSFSLLSGDFNNDNRITIEDLALILSAYTQLSVPIPPGNPIYDVNFDNVISIKDIALPLANYTNFSVPGDN